jgi:hypothetical protein
VQSDPAKNNDQHLNFSRIRLVLSEAEVLLTASC